MKENLQARESKLQHSVLIVQPGLSLRFWGDKPEACTVKLSGRMLEGGTVGQRHVLLWIPLFGFPAKNR